MNLIAALSAKTLVKERNFWSDTMRYKGVISDLIAMQQQALFNLFLFLLTVKTFPCRRKLYTTMVLYNYNFLFSTNEHHCSVTQTYVSMSTPLVRSYS